VPLNEARLSVASPVPKTPLRRSIPCGSGMGAGVGAITTATLGAGAGRGAGAVVGAGDGLCGSETLVEVETLVETEVLVVVETLVDVEVLDVPSFLDCVVSVVEVSAKSEIISPPCATFALTLNEESAGKLRVTSPDIVLKS
jgi:hypothetical protein